MPAASREKVKELAGRLGKSERTVWYWIAQGCDIENEESVRQFSEGKRLRRSNVQKGEEKLKAAFENNEDWRKRPADDSPNADDRQAEKAFVRAPKSGNGRQAQFRDFFNVPLPPPGRKGAAAALERLEDTEERAHARLILAMEKGNPFQVQELQDFWLKCSETLRKLDLAVEMARRDAEEQVPKKLAEELSLYTAEWLRIAFSQFLSSEGPTLMGIKELGEWKAYAIERFKGILELTVKSSLQTKSPIPDWAAARIKEAWNVH
jgi:hypothetical protein